MCTVGIVWVHVGAGDVPPLDGGVDASTVTLLTTGGHRQRQHGTTGERQREIEEVKFRAQ